jgi:hypothetical protein
MTDYIPHKDSKPAPWSANFTASVTTNALACGISHRRATSGKYHLLQIKTFNV